MASSWAAAAVTTPCWAVGEGAAITFAAHDDLARRVGQSAGALPSHAPPTTAPPTPRVHAVCLPTRRVELSEQVPLVSVSMHALRLGEALIRTCFCLPEPLIRTCFCLPDGRVALSGRLKPGAECLATSRMCRRQKKIS